MPLTLASLVQHSALKLGVRAGEGRLDTPVRWAHVSELADPVPYMEGGELLLITAMKLDAGDPEEMRAYVRRLAAAGVVGIGFAIGVNYEEIPEALVEAARAEDMPLLEVPRRTPFLAISKAVSAALAADQYRAVTAGFEAQRELTRAALSVDGPTELLVKLAAHVHGWAALYDTSGAVVAAAPDWAARRAARLTPDVERLRERPAPASAVVGGSEDRVELQSLGTGGGPAARSPSAPRPRWAPPSGTPSTPPSRCSPSPPSARARCTTPSPGWGPRCCGCCSRARRTTRGPWPGTCTGPCWRRRSGSSWPSRPSRGPPSRKAWRC